MVTLAGSGDITATLASSSITSLMEEPGNQNLLKLWRQEVKRVTTRITVINRFARKYSAKNLQCGIAPGLTASPQLISKLKKSNPSEGSKTRNLSTVLNSGALFNPNNPVQDAPKQKFERRTSDKKNGVGFSFKISDVFKDHRALSTIQIVLTLLTYQILEEADLLDEAFGLIIVTVIALDSRQEGTTATYNPVGRTVSLKGLLLLLCFSIYGVNAQNNSEDGKRECPSEPVDLPYNVQAVPWTIVAGIVTAFAVIAGTIYRRALVPAAAAVPVPPVPAPPVPAPPAPPVPAPPAPPVPIGFVDVTHPLEDNPAAARRSDPDFDILPEL